MSQTINDAWSGAFMTAISALIVAGVVGAMGFAWWTAETIGGMQSDIATMKSDVAAIRQDIHDRRDHQ